MLTGIASAIGGLAAGVRNLFSGEARERRQERRQERRAARQEAKASPDIEAGGPDTSTSTRPAVAGDGDKSFLQKYGIWLALGAVVLLSSGLLKPKRRYTRRRSPAKPKVVYRYRSRPAARRRR